ncbi:sensor histidine kinase [Streptococcus halotolerans]|uniref:sensor histidine kinase n=1 Tax=Streptococcus halotolerans TaxID=1814128 RepID=UPI000788D1AA|nr:HAMP domain-containing sensor histidine kinase [Streptococcus halotolerans]
MFKRLRIRFILVASLAISILMATILGITTSIRYFQTQGEISSVLEVLSENKGSFPSLDETEKRLGQPTSKDTLSKYRFVSARIASDGTVYDLNTSNISELSSEEAIAYAENLAKSGHETGRFSDGLRYYAYQVNHLKNKETFVVLLDTTVILAEYQALLKISIWLGLGGILFFTVIISVLSKKIIEPYVRNYEKQKRFITNAGHELKTPLAIISANNELVELMNGESEWTQSTTVQVRRLTDLINQMVTLARLEEQEEVVLHDLDFSVVAEDAAEDFKGPVIKDGKTFRMDITPGIHVKAEEKSLFELVTILVDNANKYCDPGGEVRVSLKPIGTVSKKAKLSISNTYKEGKNLDYSRFFERFYREDESHNNDRQAGYGIGLSMAESMVNLFHGKISAHYKNDNITFTVIL